MSYGNKSIEELINLLKERDGDIQDKTERLEQLSGEYKVLQRDISMLESTISKKENEDNSIVEKSFYAGLNSNDDLSQLKKWLNFKMENRL